MKKYFNFVQNFLTFMQVYTVYKNPILILKTVYKIVYYSFCTFLKAWFWNL